MRKNNDNLPNFELIVAGTFFDGHIAQKFPEELHPEK